MWLIYLLGFFLKIDLGILGIYPRAINSLLGIITSPFIHGSFEHLISNTFPFIILMLLFLYTHQRYSFLIFGLIYLSTNILVWIFARPAYHIGASGLVYGLASYLFFTGFYRNNMLSIAVSLIVALLYGGLVWGIVPYDSSVSWEAHLFGAICGFVVAILFRNTHQTDDTTDDFEENTDDRKSFDKFLEERR
ncbi:MAG: rhomboid family intramembrane serine protease [Chitinophagales bacterium]|nr:rhomboid family intramembrane serine protease [Chitinophagales bacterium]